MTGTAHHPWRRQRISVVELDAGCADCRYDDDPAKLVFHHRDDSTKRAGVSDMAHWRWGAIEADIDKCILPCRGCHGCRRARPRRAPDRVPTSRCGAADASEVREPMAYTADPAQSSPTDSRMSSRSTRQSDASSARLAAGEFGPAPDGTNMFGLAEQRRGPEHNLHRSHSPNLDAHRGPRRGGGLRDDHVRRRRVPRWLFRQQRSGRCCESLCSPSSRVRPKQRGVERR